MIIKGLWIGLKSFDDSCLPFLYNILKFLQNDGYFSGKAREFSTNLPFVDLEDGEEGFLWNLYAAYFFHAFFALFLLFEKLALA